MCSYFDSVMLRKVEDINVKHSDQPTLMVGKQALGCEEILPIRSLINY